MARTPPLNPALPMVDDQGRPTPFFMRWWQEQVDTNRNITDLSTPAAVSAVLDVLGTAARGQVVYRGPANWELLSPDLTGKIFRTNGAGADPSWDTISSVLDDALGDTRGSVIYRGASGWAILTPGTALQVLTTNGPSADPTWEDVSATFLDLTDTPASYTGEALKAVRVNAGETALEFYTPAAGASTFVALSDTPANFTGAGNRVLKVNSAANAVEFVTLTSFLDTIFGSTQGGILYRGASAWALLGPGTSGQYLQTQGAAANPQWATVAAGGGGGNAYYDIASGFNATPGVSEVFDTLVIGRNITIPANMSGSVGTIGTNPTSSFAIDVQDDGVSIGTITISTGGAFTFVTTSGTEKAVAAGSVLTFIAPSPADATAAGCAFTILATADGTNYYDIQAGFSTTPLSSEVLETIVLGREVTFPANFSGSVGDAGTNPTGTFAIDVQDDGVSIGTISVSTGGVFTFTTTSGTAKVVAAGSVLTFIAPGTADATAADFYWSLIGEAA